MQPAQAPDPGTESPGTSTIVAAAGTHFLPELPFSRADWEAACYVAFGEGRDPATCPDCGRTGFYGPRIEEPDRRYRQCRFCGFTQEVDSPPQRYRPTVHRCAHWPSCAHTPYIWWVAPKVAAYRCPFCRGRVIVSKALVRRPADDPRHAWQHVPQRKSRFYYAEFWSNWEYTKGRVEL